MTDTKHPVAVTGFVIGAMLIALIGVWGIITGVGILRLRRWAWFCMLAIAVLLIAAAVPGILHAPRLIRATTGIPTVGAQGLIVAEYVNLVFTSILPLALGIWWLLLFVLRSTRAQFAAPATREAQLAPDSSVVYTAGAAFIPPPPVFASRRPVSITVIAVFLLAGGAAFPLLLLYPRNWRITVLFGVLLTGSKVLAVLLPWCVAELALGIGLFRLKPWARVGTIVYCFAAMANGIASVRSMGRLMQAFHSAIGGPAMPQFPPTAMRIISIFGIAFNVALNSVAIYFLVTRAPAFEDSPPFPSASPEEPGISAAAPPARNGAPQ